MKININQQVKIKLTDSGKEVYQKYFKELNVKMEVKDEIVMPLWEFSQIFGKELYMGQTKAPFTENNQIELV